MSNPGSKPGTEAAFVVLIDDDALCLSALAMTFENMGFQAHTVRLVPDPDRLTGLERRPCLALVDYQMRDGLSGVDCVRALRSRFPGLPCIFLTGDTSPGSREEAEALGCVMLRKPVRPDTLMAAANLAMERCPMRGQPANPCRCVACAVPAEAGAA